MSNKCKIKWLLFYKYKLFPFSRDYFFKNKYQILRRWVKLYNLNSLVNELGIIGGHSIGKPNDIDQELDELLYCFGEIKKVLDHPGGYDQYIKDNNIPSISFSELDAADENELF